MLSDAAPRWFKKMLRGFEISISDIRTQNHNPTESIAKRAFHITLSTKAKCAGTLYTKWKIAVWITLIAIHTDIKITLPKKLLNSGCAIVQY